MKHRLLSVCLTFLALGLYSKANAWNNVGHRAIAELVWRRMDATQRNAASKLLRQHPHYKEILLQNAPRGVPRDEWAFLTAAVWPDMVRPAKPGQTPKPGSVTKY